MALHKEGVESTVLELDGCSMNLQGLDHSARNVEQANLCQVVQVDPKWMPIFYLQRKS